MVQFVFKCIEEFFLLHLAHDLSVLDEKSFSVSARDPDICFLGLTGAVDRTSHDGDFNIEVVALHHGLHLVCQADQIVWTDYANE